jgi:hypothetical protein
MINTILCLLSQCISIQNTGCFDGVSSTFTWDTLWKIIMQGEFQQKHLSSVGLNSVCHRDLSGCGWVPKWYKGIRGCMSFSKRVSLQTKLF